MLKIVWTTEPFLYILDVVNTMFWMTHFLDLVGDDKKKKKEKKKKKKKKSL